MWVFQLNYVCMRSQNNITYIVELNWKPDLEVHDHISSEELRLLTLNKNLSIPYKTDL